MKFPNVQTVFSCEFTPSRVTSGDPLYQQDGYKHVGTIFRSDICVEREV